MIKEAALYVLNKGAQYALEKAGGLIPRGRSRSPWRGSYRFMSGRYAKVSIAEAMRGAAYACISRRGNAVKALQWKVKRQVSQTQSQDVSMDHWAVELLKKPNPRYVRSEIFEWIEYYTSTKGNAYFWTPILDGDTHPRQMWPLPTHMVTINTGNTDSIIESYRFTINGYYIDIPPDQMLHFRNLKPGQQSLSMIEGYPRVNAAADSIQADSETKEFIRRYMQNDGLSPLVGMGDEDTPPDWDSTRKSIMEKMPALKIIGFLGGGMKLMPINNGGVSGSGNTQMLAAAEPVNFKNICFAFDMKPSMLDGTATSYLNADAIDYDFHSNAIEPFALYISEVFTAHLCQFEPGLVIEHVKFVRRDPSHDLAVKQALGYVINEERLEQGKPAIPGGDVYMQPSGFLPLGSSAATTQNPQLPAQQNAVQLAQKNLELEDKKLALWKGIDDIRERREIHIKRRVVGAFALLKEHIIGKVSKNHRPGVLKEGVSLDSLFDLEEWIKIFEDEVAPEVHLTMIEAAQKAAELVSRSWDDIKSNYDGDMEFGLNRSTSKISGDPLSTVHRELDSLLKENFSLPAAELAKLIGERFDNIYSVSRANLIAKTTATFSINESQKIVWRGLGFKRKWLSSRGATVRDIHRAADGQVEDEDGFFTVGGEKIEQPGEGTPANACNCGCYTTPEVVD